MKERCPSRVQALPSMTALARDRKRDEVSDENNETE
jgi:hypothetical protein